MKSEIKSPRLQDVTPSGPVESPEELYDETLSSLVQSWEVNVDAIDISARVMTAISAEPEAHSARVARTIASLQHASESTVPSVDIRIFRPEPEALRAIPAEFALKNGILPIRRDGNRLWVAMGDPRNVSKVDDIRFMSRCLVQPMIADPVDLEKAVAEAYITLDPPLPPVPPTAIAAPAQEPADEMTRLLRETLVEMRGMRDELSSLRREVAELRRDRSATVPRPSTARLFPFAPPESASQRDR